MHTMPSKDRADDMDGCVTGAVTTNRTLTQYKNAVQGSTDPGPPIPVRTWREWEEETTSILLIGSYLGGLGVSVNVLIHN